MITYINSENAKKYSRLFSEAEDALVRYWKGLGLSDDQIQIAGRADSVVSGQVSRRVSVDGGA